MRQIQKILSRDLELQADADARAIAKQAERVPPELSELNVDELLALRDFKTRWGQLTPAEIDAAEVIAGKIYEATARRSALEAEVIERLSGGRGGWVKRGAMNCKELRQLLERLDGDASDECTRLDITCRLRFTPAE